MKKSMKLFVAITLLVFAGIGTAQAQKVVAVNYGKALEQSPQFAAFQKSLEADNKKKNSALNAKQKKIKKLEDQLKKDKDVMSSAEVKRLEQDIRTQRRKLSFELQESRDDLNMRIAEERRKMIRQIIEVVREIGKEEKVDLVLSEGVVYASPAADITDKVIARMKKKYKGK